MKSNMITAPHVTGQQSLPSSHDSKLVTISQLSV